MQQEQKLGRGLSALLGENKSKKEFSLIVDSTSHLDVDLIPLTKIKAGAYQPRYNFNQGELDELANSIKENGVIQPIILRKNDKENGYEIIAGERRFRAAKLANLTEIPAIIKKVDGQKALEMAIIENIQRADLSVVEEAKGYKQLMEEFSHTQEQVAKKLGKSRSHIANFLRILGLPELVLKALDEKQISMGHARALVNSHYPEKLVKKIIDENLNVRQVEDLVREEKSEKIKNTVLSVETGVGSSIRKHLTNAEKGLSDALNMKVKISYNPSKNSGKIFIKFDELDKVQQLLKKLEEKGL